MSRLGWRRRRKPRPVAGRPRLAAALSAVLAWLGLLGAGCSATAPEPGHAPGYAYPVPPDTTFDLRRGEAVPDSALLARLAPVRLLFLGEHHTDPNSHAFQRALLGKLADSGRPLVVALEMFPPSVDPVLEDWRQGRLDELTFLERSDWYRHWGHPWAAYRALFTLFRERHVALHGVNAERTVRDAVRADKTADLPPDVRALLGDPDETVVPHAAYLLDTLREIGHGGDLHPDSDGFRRFYRVQRMWDRLMGRRALALAEHQPADGIAVLLVGSGHLAFGLGANLQAARATTLPTLSVWDTAVEPAQLDGDGRYAVPLAMADWVRVYVEREDTPETPSLGGLRLEADPAGVRVKGVFARPGSPLKVLHGDDVIVALNGAAPRSPTALRLAYESVPTDRPARLDLLRGGQRLTVELPPPGGTH